VYTKEKKICAKQVLNMKKIGTVFIADDESIIRDGLKCILDWESLGFELCGEAANGEDTLQAILTLKPSLVLLDIRMPKMHGLEIVKAAREKKYKGKFVILSGYSDFKYAQEAIKYGVDFYLTNRSMRMNFFMLLILYATLF
jgi:two-component system, response regulator YesN